jgi:hypothetical protein
MKTSELTGAALDWAVATCLGYTNLRQHRYTTESFLEWVMDPPPRVEYGPVELGNLAFSFDWSQGGPIIERENIGTYRSPKAGGGSNWVGALEQDYPYFFRSGPTPLIAAMRCFVASKLGDDVDVPKELT